MEFLQANVACLSVDMSILSRAAYNQIVPFPLPTGMSHVHHIARNFRPSTARFLSSNSETHQEDPG
jgi:hypothetical protein